jgi:hypothetical protein
MSAGLSKFSPSRTEIAEEAGRRRVEEFKGPSKRCPVVVVRGLLVGGREGLYASAASCTGHASRREAREKGQKCEDHECHLGLYGNEITQT